METVAPIVGGAGAILAAFVGALLTIWLKRGRPWLGIKSVDRDDRHLVPIPAGVKDLVNRQSRWVGRLQGDNAPLYRFKDTFDRAQQAADLCKVPLDSTRRLRDQVKAGFSSQTAKKAAIGEFLSDSVAVQVLSGMAIRGMLPVPERIELPDATEPLLLGDDMTTVDGEEKGFLIYSGSNNVFLRAGGGTIGFQILKRFRTLGHILQYGVETPLASVLEALDSELQTDLQALLEIKERLADVVKSRALIIRAEMFNYGATPVHIDPFGVLKVNSGGKAIKPFLVTVQDFRVYEPGAEELPRLMQLIEGLSDKIGVSSARTPSDRRDSPEYVVLPPGSIVNVELATMGTVEDESVVDALRAGMLSCQLILKRPNKLFWKWVRSDVLILGEALNEEKREGLMSVGTSR